MGLAMAAFAVEDVLFKSATSEVPVSLALLVFGLLGMGIFAALSLKAREPVWHAAVLSPGLLLRSASELAGRLFFALALAFTPLSSTSAILQATPLVVTLGAVVFFGAKVGPRRWIAMTVGLIGVLLILQPTPDSFEPASIFAVLAMLGFAGRDLATRASPVSMSGRQLGTLGFGVIVIAGVVLLPTAPLPQSVPAPWVFGFLALTSVFGVAAYSALTIAMRTGDVAVVTPFRYSRLLFALAFAVIVFGERPDVTPLIGAALIVASGLFTLLRSQDEIAAGPGR